MSSGDRFYQLELRHRHALHGDIGSILKIEGLVVGGEDAQAILLLPGNTIQGDTHRLGREYVLTPEQWTEWLQRSDNPEILVMPAKAFHRKVRYEISGHVQQKVWLADGLKCMYCGAKMGAAQLTVDHWMPLELGGANNTSNYLSADRKCNKLKGSMHPQQWCDERKLDYAFFVDYLSSRRIA